MKSEFTLGTKSISRTKVIVTVGIFSAISFVLQWLGSLIGLKVGGFLEIEISDLPALILSMAYGPLIGVLVELIKNILHCAITSTGFVGELANFVINGVLCFTCGIFYKYHRTFQGAVLAFLLGVAVMVITGALANLYVMLPLYMPQSDFAARLAIVKAPIIPFNICKGLGLSVITLVVYKRISKVIR